MRHRRREPRQRGRTRAGEVERDELAAGEQEALGKGLPHVEVTPDTHQQDQRLPGPLGPDTHPRWPYVNGPAAIGFAGRHDDASLARSTFLSNLPTAVLGTSSINSTRSGNCQRANPLLSRWRCTSSEPT